MLTITAVIRVKAGTEAAMRQAFLPDEIER